MNNDNYILNNHFSGGNPKSYSLENLMDWFKNEEDFVLEFNSDNKLNINSITNNLNHTLLKWIKKDSDIVVKLNELSEHLSKNEFTEIINYESDDIPLIEIIKFFVENLTKQGNKLYIEKNFKNNDASYYINKSSKVFITICKEINSINDTEKKNDLLRFNNCFIIMLNIMAEPTLYFDLFFPKEFAMTSQLMPEIYINKLELSLKGFFKFGNGILSEEFITNIYNDLQKSESTGGKEGKNNRKEILNSLNIIRDEIKSTTELEKLYEGIVYQYNRGILFDTYKDDATKGVFRKGIFDIETIYDVLKDHEKTLGLLSVYIIIILNEYYLKESITMLKSIKKAEKDILSKKIEKIEKIKEGFLEIISDKSGKKLINYIDYGNKDYEIEMIELEILTSSISSIYSSFVNSINGNNEILKLLKSNYKKENYETRKIA
tara:strand:- start:4023 stop:5324 length:1302 start_codon:yes stop_codon:yes gene_type:complete